MLGYANARAMLESRRNAELEIEAVRRQIDRCYASPMSVGSGTPAREKVPGKDEYVLRPRGTNNQIGAALQHEDGYTEALQRLLDSKSELLETAESALAMLDDAVDRTILRYYYCQAMTDEQTAEIMHFERRSICKRRNEAVDELEERWQKSTA